MRGTNDFTVFQEAAANLISRIDPMETVRHGEINLFHQVYNYGLTTTAPDLKGKKVLDIRPQTRRNPDEDFRQTFSEDFDRDKEVENDWFSVEFDDAVKFIRIDKSIGNSITVTDTSSSSYTAGTGVSNIAEDTVIKLDGENSLRFDVSLGQNLITWANSTLDLSAHKNKSSFFLEVYWPDASIITSIKVRVGSSAADYYEITGSLQLGTARNGVNLYRFDWNGATETGSVDEASTDYVRYEITTTAADTDIRIGRLSSKLPSPHEVVYYSKALFRPFSGSSTWLDLPSNDTDIINLDSDALNIFIYECCAIIASDLEFEAEVTKFQGLLGVSPDGRLTGGGLYGDYKRDKPSESIKPSSRWYRPPVSVRRRFRLR